MNPPDTTVRDTLLGILLGGALFGSVAVVQALRASVALGSVLQPILVRCSPPTRG